MVTVSPVTVAAVLQHSQSAKLQKKQLEHRLGLLKHRSGRRSESPVTWQVIPSWWHAICTVASRRDNLPDQCSTVFDACNFHRPLKLWCSTMQWRWLNHLECTQTYTVRVQELAEVSRKQPECLPGPDEGSSHASTPYSDIMQHGHVIPALLSPEASHCPAHAAVCMSHDIKCSQDENRTQNCCWPHLEHWLIES